MNCCWIILLFVMVFFMVVCSKSVNDVEKDSLVLGEVNKWNDLNYDIIIVGFFNYMDYDIYGVYLLLFDKNSFDDVVSVDGVYVMFWNVKYWFGGGGLCLSFVWDFCWKILKMFKVWWECVVDKCVMEVLFVNYDLYMYWEIQLGMVWCEGEIMVMWLFVKDKSGGIVLYFFFDGWVEGDMDFEVDGLDLKVVLFKCDVQCKLVDCVCLKEIFNLFYGCKKLVQWN